MNTLFTTADENLSDMTWAQMFTDVADLFTHSILEVTAMGDQIAHYLELTCGFLWVWTSVETFGIMQVQNSTKYITKVVVVDI